MSLNIPTFDQTLLMNTMWDVPGITQLHTDGIIGLFGDGTGSEAADYFFYHLFTPSFDLRLDTAAQYFNLCYQIASNPASDFHCLETWIETDWETTN